MVNDPLQCGVIKPALRHKAVRGYPDPIVLGTDRFSTAIGIYDPLSAIQKENSYWIAVQQFSRTSLHGPERPEPKANGKGSFKMTVEDRELFDIFGLVPADPSRAMKSHTRVHGRGGTNLADKAKS